jgi:hypothetical protein
MDNLRIIPWKENAVKWMKPATRVPKIMWSYMKMYEERVKFTEHIRKAIPSLKNYVGEDCIDLVNKDETVYIAFHCYDNVVERNVGTKNYLKNMTDSFTENGKRILHFFEDEWGFKPDIVLNKIKHILHHTGESEKIFARK